MRRYSTDFLENWLSSHRRKPLVMRGARQVGKTWLVRNLAQTTKKHLVEINFEQHPELYKAFKSNEPQIILRGIEQGLGIKIDIDQSILFLDEIQVFPELLAKLRWFYELLPALAVVVAGSLLDFALDDHEFSMPVGRISYLHINPLSFEEFLEAKKSEDLVSFLREFKIGDEIPELVHARLINLFREYLIVGGMPSAVQTWTETNSLRETARVHSELLMSYRDDFSKYAGKISTSYLEETMTAIPQLLGQKFIYSHVNPDIKATALKNTLNLLCKARIGYKVRATSANGLPLLAEVDNRRFKVVFIDVGLACALLSLRLDQIEAAEDINLINQGAISEQVVEQLLRCSEPGYSEVNHFYWCREGKNSSAEIDYVVQHANHIIPIEIKSGKTGSMKSLHLFMHLKKKKFAARINSDVPSMVDVDVKSHDGKSIHYQLLSIPFYLIEQLPRLLDEKLLGVPHVTK
jgi:predicted AAA+ superfamily ATPase